MRSALYGLAFLLALPQILLCAVFLAVGHVTGGRGLGEVFMRLLDLVYVVFTWGGLLAIVGLLVLLAAGFSARWRRAGAGVVAGLTLGSGITLAVQGIDPFLFLPGVVALGVSFWLMDVRKAFTVAGGPEIQRGESP